MSKETWLDIGGLDCEYYIKQSKKKKHRSKNLIVLDPHIVNPYGNMDVICVNSKVSKDNKLPFADSSLDRIDTNFMFVQLVSNPPANNQNENDIYENIMNFLNECSRVIKPEGKVLLCEPLGLLFMAKHLIEESDNLKLIKFRKARYGKRSRTIDRWIKDYNIVESNTSAYSWLPDDIKSKVSERRELTKIFLLEATK